MKNISFTAFQERLSLLTPVQKVLLFAGTLLLMGAAFYFLKFESQYDRLNQLKSQITSGSNKDLSLLRRPPPRCRCLKKRSPFPKKNLQLFS